MSSSLSSFPWVMWFLLRLPHSGSVALPAPISLCSLYHLCRTDHSALRDVHSRFVTACHFDHLPSCSFVRLGQTIVFVSLLFYFPATLDQDCGRNCLPKRWLFGLECKNCRPRFVYAAVQKYSLYRPPLYCPSHIRMSRLLWIRSLVMPFLPSLPGELNCCEATWVYYKK